MSSTQFIRHLTSTANSNRIKPTTRTAKHDILFIQSYASQAYSLELPFINNWVCFDRNRSHAHAFQPVDPISFRFPGKLSQSRKRSGRCLLSCAQNWELRKRSDWRICGLVAPLRVVFESRLANQRPRCPAAGRESMTVCLMRGSHFVYNGYSRR